MSPPLFPSNKMSTDDDDDWGDFVLNPAILSHNLSLPKPTAGTHFDSKPTQPSSAPCRVNSVTPFHKSRGALPLSLFGGINEEQEEAGRSDGETPSLGNKDASLFAHNNVNDSKKNKKYGALSVNEDDLIANLYKQAAPVNGLASDFKRSNPDPRGLDPAAKLNHKELSIDSAWNWADRNSNNGNAVNEKKLDFDSTWNWVDRSLNNGHAANEKKLDLSYNPLNLDQNGVDLGKNGVDSGTKDMSSTGGTGCFGSKEEEEDDGWEFQGADSLKGVEEISKTDQSKTEKGVVSNGSGFNSSWNTFSLDFSGSNPNITSSGDLLNMLSVAGNRELSNNHEWTLKDAPAMTPVGDEKDDQSKIENTPKSDCTEFSLGWGLHPASDSGSPNLSGLNSNGKQMSSNFVGLDNHFDDASGWSFMNPVSQVHDIDGNTKSGEMKTENKPAFNFDPSYSDWNTLSSNGAVTKQSSNGLNLDREQSNVNSPDIYSEGEDGWEFKAAESKSWATTGNTKALAYYHQTNIQMEQDDGRSLGTSEEAASMSGFSNGTPASRDIFSASDRTFHQAAGWDFGFDLKQGSLTQESNNSKSKQNDAVSNSYFSPSDAKEESWASKDAFTENGATDQRKSKDAEVPTTMELSTLDGEIKGNVVRSDNHRVGLPLSIFGEEEEADDPVINLDISSQMATVKRSDSIKNPQSKISINDLISSLYSQPEHIITVNHMQNLVENGSDSTKTEMSSSLANDGGDDFGDDSWEFKDASTGVISEDQSCILKLGGCHTKSSTKTELTDYADFFSKLKEQLHVVALGHLKKAQSATIWEDAKGLLDKNIEDLDNVLRQNGMVFSDVNSENPSPIEVCLSEFVEALLEPRFQVLESEYQLSKKLPAVENDIVLTIELLKLAVSIVKILTLVSREEQCTYVSIWSKLLSACAQELKHGALIWNQLIQNNLCDEVLSKSQGKKYIIALGEVFRVVEVLRSSINLYKPWILATSTDPSGMLTLLSECSTLWSTAGLEEALHNISDLAGLEYDGSLESLRESIRHIQSLDSLALYDHVFSGEGPVCRLSFLTAGTMAGMETVVWDGECYFLKLANLWANLVSGDPPHLPEIEVGG